MRKIILGTLVGISGLILFNMEPEQLSTVRIVNGYSNGNGRIVTQEANSYQEWKHSTRRNGNVTVVIDDNGTPECYEDDIILNVY